MLTQPQDTPMQDEAVQGAAKKRITIAGAGFSGTLTAIRLMHLAEAPLEICLLEREEGYRYGGIAYGTAATTWEHMLNIQAGRITLYRERAEDFLEWANNEADRTEWPPRWQYHQFGLSCVVPRRIYRQYLRERLQRAAAQAGPRVSLTELNGEVIEVRAAHGVYQVTYAAADTDGSPHTLRSDVVVLATGHLGPVSKSFYHRLRGSERFIPDPYAPEARAAFEAVEPTETVLVVGTALSAFDAIVSLIAAGHHGRVILNSRGGHLHATYPSDHQHDIWQVRRPPFLDDGDLTLQAVVDGIRAEYEYLRGVLTKEHNVDPAVLAERVMKAWEPYVAELAERMAPKDLQQLFDTYKSLIVTSRTSTVPEIGNVVRNRMRGYNGAPRTVSVEAGKILDMRPVQGGDKIRVCLRDQPDILVDRVVNCLGSQTDYGHPDHPLWDSLVRQHAYAQPHRLTGRGVEVTWAGQLVAPGGRTLDRLYCVGPMRQGDETTRRGRLGAFVFSIGTVRNQCFETAAEILRHLRHADDKDFAVIPEDAHQRLGDGFTWLIGHLNLDLAKPDAERLRRHLTDHAQGSAVPLSRACVLAEGPAERAARRQALTDETDRLRAALEGEFPLERGQAVRLVTLAGILVDRHAVQGMCDITRLSEWRSASYKKLVTTGGQHS
jgi:uncharacterized NAD(P)/FAD-binding protein YdhS